LKRTLILIRRVIIPQKRIFANVNGRYSFDISEENLPFYIDLTDHLERIADSTETSRDLVNGALDTYYTIISAKTTENMRVLTIISTIILPLTFITGLFGMNTFSWLGHEAEPYMLIIALSIMLLMTFSMLYIFKKRKWL